MPTETTTDETEYSLPALLSKLGYTGETTFIPGLAVIIKEQPAESGNGAKTLLLQVAGKKRSGLIQLSLQNPQKGFRLIYSGNEETPFTARDFIESIIPVNSINNSQNKLLRNLLGAAVLKLTFYADFQTGFSFYLAGEILDIKGELGFCLDKQPGELPQVSFNLLGSKSNKPKSIAGLLHDLADLDPANPALAWLPPVQMALTRLNFNQQLEEVLLGGQFHYNQPNGEGYKLNAEIKLRWGSQLYAGLHLDAINAPIKLSPLLESFSLPQVALPLNLENEISLCLLDIEFNPNNKTYSLQCSIGFWEAIASASIKLFDKQLELKATIRYFRFTGLIKRLGLPPFTAAFPTFLISNLEFEANSATGNLSFSGDCETEFLLFNNAPVTFNCRLQAGYNTTAKTLTGGFEGTATLYENIMTAKLAFGNEKVLTLKQVHDNEGGYVSLKQLIDNVSGNKISLPDWVPDCTVKQFEAEINFSTGALKLSGESIFSWVLPGTKQAVIVNLKLEVNKTPAKETGKFDFTGNFAPSLQIGPATFAVEFVKNENGRIFKGGWKIEKDDAIGFHSIASMLDISLDASLLPAILNPQLREVAFEYNEQTKTFAFTACTTTNAVCYFIAKTDNADKWQYVLGLEYDINSDKPENGLPEELVEAAKTAKLQKLSLLYAGAALKDFALPLAPNLSSVDNRQLSVSKKILNTEPGIFFAAGLQQIELPQIGKIKPDIDKFYVEVSRSRELTKARVKGEVSFSLEGVPSPLKLNVEAAYEHGKGLAFHGLIESKFGLRPFAEAVLPEGFSLPAEITIPDIEKTEITLNTADNSFAITLTAQPQQNAFEIPGFIKAKADSLKFKKDKEGFLFKITNGNIFAEALKDVLPTGIGGTLDLNISEKKSYFRFYPDGFTITTPAIEYDEVQKVDDNGKFNTIKKKIQGEVRPGDFTIEKDEKTGWSVTASAKFSLAGMPYPASLLFDSVTDGQTVPKLFDGSFKINSAGASVTVSSDPLVGLIIPDILAAIDSDNQLPKFGESAVCINSITCRIGKEIDMEIEGGIALPSNINGVLGFAKPLIRTFKKDDPKSYVGLQLTLGTSGIIGKVTGSPFDDGGFISKIDDDKIEFDFDKLFGSESFGAVVFIKPEIRLDVKTGSFRFSGGYKLDPKRGLRLPLYPVKRLMEALKLKAIADSLPASLPIKSLNLNETLDDMRNRLKSIEGCPKELVDLFSTVHEHLNKLPARFVDYLAINVPNDLVFDIHVTADGGVSFSVETKGDPLQFLMPTPVSFAGYRLKKLSFGTALGGSLLKLEISGEVDNFDYLTLAGSYLLLDQPNIAEWLPKRNEIRQTFTATDMIILIVYQTYIPIPIPIFYKELSIKTVGIEGVGISASISFQKPTFNAMKLLKIVLGAKDFILKGEDFKVDYPITFKEEPGEPEMNLIFSAGPFYLQLPKYITKESDGSPKRIGILKSYRLFDALNTTGVVLNGIKQLVMEGSPAYLIKAFPLEYRNGEIAAGLLGIIDVQFKWLFSTPAELLQIAKQNPGFFADQAEATQLLSRLQRTGPVFIESGKTPAKYGLQDTDNGLAIFMKGAFTMESIASFSVEGGLVSDGRAFGLCYRIAGDIASNKLIIDLRGMLVIRQGSFAMEGNAQLNLLGIDLFSGKYRLANDGFLIEASTPPGVPGLPFEFYGKLEGVFKQNHIAVSGETTFRIWFLSMSGTTSLLIDAPKGDGAPVKPSYFVFNGQVSLGDYFFVKTDFDTSLSHGVWNTKIKLDAKFLGILGLNFSGEGIVAAGNLRVNSNVCVTFFGNNILTSLLSITNDELRVEGTFNFIPGVMSITGDAFLRRENLLLTGSGSIKIGPFNCSTTLKIEASQNVNAFDVTVFNMLGQNETIAFALNSRADGLLKLYYKADKALSVMNGMLTITSADSYQNGPEAYLVFKDAVLHQMYFSGGIVFLGIRDTTQLLADGETFRFTLNKKWDLSSVFKGEMSLSGIMRQDYLKASTSISMTLDFMPILSILFPNSEKSDKLDIGISLKNLSITIDKSQTPEEQHNQRLRDQELIAQRLLNEARLAINQANRVVQAQIEQLNQTIKQLNASEALAPNTIRMHCEELQSIIDKLNNLRSQNEGDINLKAQISIRLANAQKLKTDTQKNVDEFERLHRKLDSAASQWWIDGPARNKHYEPFHGTLQELKNHINILKGPFNAGDVDKYLDDMQNYMFWSYFDSGTTSNRTNSFAAFYKLVNMFHQLDSRAAGNLQEVTNEFNRVTAEADGRAQEINVWIEKGDGNILLALADLRRLAVGTRKKSENIYIPIENADSLMLAGAEPYRMAIDVQLIFNLNGKEFNLLNLHWVQILPAYDPDKDFMDQLPGLITSYLRDNFFDLLIAALGSIRATIEFVRKLIFGGSMLSEQDNQRRLEVDNESLHALEVLTGIENGNDLMLTAKAAGIGAP